jgi:hypothetical protein
MKWYWYSSPQPCYKELDALIELMRTEVGIGPEVRVIVLIFKAPEIRIIVEKIAKANIKSAEKSPQSFSYHARLTTAKIQYSKHERIILLRPVRIHAGGIVVILQSFQNRRTTGRSQRYLTD